MTALWSHLLFAFRALRRSPGFAASTVLVLALAIGANTVMFSLVQGVLLRPLPYRDPDRLYLVTEVIPKVRDLYPSIPVPARHVLAWEERARSFDGFAAMEGMTLNLTGAGEPERLGAARVSWNLLRLLGLRPSLGRDFLRDEDQPGRDRVVLISESLWRRRFGADPGVLERTISLDGIPYTIVGVLPAGFAFAREEQLHPLVRLPDRIDVWKPLAFTTEEATEPANWNYGVIGRLGPGFSPEAARAELDAMLPELVADFPEPIEIHAELTPLHEALVGGSRRGLLVLLAAVGAVLLVGCVNVANLLLVRATVRERESAIRLALGITRGGLIRQSLAESLLLALAGGGLGVALAAAGTGAVARWGPRDLPRIEEVSLDPLVLVFAMALALGTGILFGLLPAWRASPTEPQAALRQGARGSTYGPTGGRLRAGLVAAEVGLSAVLLVAAGLLLRSHVQLGRMEKGFETERVLAMDVGLPEAQYVEEERRAVFYREVIERLEGLPGVLAAGAVSTLPLSGETNVSPASAEGATVPLLERPIANSRNVSSGYFRTLGITLREGQVFTNDPGERPLAIVSESLARRLWPGQIAIGKRLRTGDLESPLMEVVGVVGDIRGVGLDKEPGYMVYAPFSQDPDYNLSLVLRTALPPQAVAAAARREIRAVDADVPVPRIRTMAEVVSGSVAQRRFQMQLVGAFGVAALFLASLGIFGVVSYAVAQRRQELGIRIALGATGSQVRRAVLLQGMKPVAMGVGAGLAASLAFARLLQSLLFGVGTTDPVTLAGVPVLLLAVAAAACAVPAIRATRIDPMVTLRAE